MSTNFSKGSEWRRWDLHFHTPSSFDYDDKSVADAEIVATLKSAGISVVAITDHHFMDVERIKSLKALGGDDLVVLPGIELRSNLGGSESIHFIGIFPEDADLTTLWTKLQGNPLNIAPADVKTKGDDKVYCDFNPAVEYIHELGGIVTIHAGSKSNTLEKITNALTYKQAQKEDILRLIDIYEIGKPADVADYEKNVIPNIAHIKIPPMILGSDNHNVRNYKIKQYCWIKADPTFQGLRRTLEEPRSRVFIGSTPDKLADVNAHQTKYIANVELGPEVVGSGGAKSWFADNLPVNPGLVAIIGKKGSGKSALADIIALAGDSHIDPTRYSFLNRDKFRKRGLAAQYSATLTWADRSTLPTNLNGEVDVKTEVERVKYLSQEYVETICNEAGVSDRFQKEIDNVVFSYIPDTDILGATNLRELITLHTKPIDERLSRLRQNLSETIDRYINLEAKGSPDYRKQLENKYIERKKEVDNLIVPVEVLAPPTEIDAITQAEIDRLNESHASGLTELHGIATEIASINAKLSSIKNILSRIDEFKERWAETSSLIQPDLSILGLVVQSLVEVKVNTTLLTDLELTLTGQRSTLRENLSELTKKQTGIEASLAEIHLGLDQQNRLYREYLQAKKDYEVRKLAIEGEPGTDNINTMNGLEKEITYLGSILAEDVKNAYKEIVERSIAIFNTLFGKSGIYQDIYKPLIEFMTERKSEQEKAESVLGFDVGIVCNKEVLIRTFLSFINHGRDGSFQGIEPGYQRIKEIAQRHYFNTNQETLAFVEEVLKNLRNDMTSATAKVMEINAQLVSGAMKKQELLKFLFGLEYLDVKYKLIFNGKDLNQDEFSPGEKGAILLIFYLLIDKDRIPLIIDQPEENLDNESVYSLLVPYIKQAKASRQIIIVTHNPNIAVVCDAEQIICASMDKAKCEIRYRSGSIENREINGRIIDVLEGTMPAFQKRGNAYQTEPRS